MLVGAGQLVEQRGFAAVLVAGQGKGERCALGNGRTRLAVVVAGRAAQLAHAGVGDGGMPLLAGGGAVGAVDVLHRDFRGILQPQGQFIAAQLHLDGVAHGGYLAQRDFGTGGKPHIQQVVAQFSCAADGLDQRILPDFQFRQCHSTFPNLLAWGTGRKHLINTEKV